MIKVQDIVLKKGYRLLLPALSFHLKQGQCLELVGSNGCGKTTLLKLLARQHQPFKGRIQYKLLNEKPLYLGLTSGFDPDRSLKDNLCYLLALEHLREDALDPLLSSMQLNYFKDKPYKCLSAGQKQRAHLMRLILWPRTCWLLDEPTTSLDPAGHKLLKQMCQDHQTKGGFILIATPQPLSIGEPIKYDFSSTISFVNESQNNQWV